MANKDAHTGGGKSFSPDMIDFIARELEWAADEVDRSGQTMPDSIDASVLGKPIAALVEAVAANIAALATGLYESADDCHAAADRYRSGEEHNARQIGQIMDTLADIDPTPPDRPKSEPDWPDYGQGR